MEENREILELLQSIEKTNRQQLRTGRLQCLFSLIAAAFCGAAFVLVFQFLPQLTDVTARMQTVLGNLEQVTQQLSAIDMAGMVADVDALVTTAQQGLNQAIEKITALDIDTLNQAIQDLADVIEPLAKLNSMFR